MTKHSRKLIIAAVLAALVATPVLAASPANDTGSSVEAGWATVVDIVEGWFNAVFGASETTPEDDPSNDETVPHGDPNEGSFSGVDPNGDDACSSEPCAEGFPGVDPNG